MSPDIDEDLLLDLRDYALKVYAKKYPARSEHAEDFASFCTVKWLSGDTQLLKCTVYTLLVDYFRLRSNTYGTYKARGSDWYYSFIPLDELGVEAKLSYVQKELEAKLLTYLDTFKTELSSQQRMALILYGLFGFNGKELALCFGVCESRAMQILSQGTELLSKLVANNAKQ